MEITRSNKGGAKLCYQGYMYTKHATRKTQQWWKCVKWSSTGCKLRGSISTSLQNENPTTGQSHNHDPSETNVTYTKARLTMKEQATSISKSQEHITCSHLNYV